MPLSNMPWLLPTPRKLKRKVAKPRSDEGLVQPLDDPVVHRAAALRVRVEDHRNRRAGAGPGWKRPSRRPSGPGKMTSGMLRMLSDMTVARGWRGGGVYIVAAPLIWQSAGFRAFDLTAAPLPRPRRDHSAAARSARRDAEGWRLGPTRLARTRKAARRTRRWKQASGRIADGARLAA